MFWPSNEKWCCETSEGEAVMRGFLLIVTRKITMYLDIASHWISMILSECRSHS